MAAIIGGAKLSTKIPVILEQMDKVDRLIIGGAIVFTFLCALGYKVGRNKVEAEFLTQALEIARKAKKKGMKLLLPKDVVCCATMPFQYNIRSCLRKDCAEGFGARSALCQEPQGCASPTRWIAMA